AKDGTPLAGGRALKTPFGTFYGPNITPDPVHGIGGWTDAQFIAALRWGEAPDGSNLYPVFPYTSFTLMSDSDILDLKAYLFSLPPAPDADRPHDVAFPFGWRFLLTPWKWLNFSPGPFEPDPDRSAEWNRGAYMVNAVGHCGECHTPRGWLGEMRTSVALSGNPEGPDGMKAPNITPDPATGIGGWTKGQIVTVLRSGLLPDGDVVGSAMGEVVENSTSKLTDADRAAIATYLMSLKPVRNDRAKATQPGF
ncbi:MAG: cytochrome c, partial [Rhodospirillaceae bacterium]|nr:cytochrome c [Rhodospirillaceae bacterium]